MNNRRRNFRSRPSKNNFRRRNGVSNSNSPSNYNNGNKKQESYWKKVNEKLLSESLSIIVK